MSEFQLDKPIASGAYGCVYNNISKLRCRNTEIKSLDDKVAKLLFNKTAVREMDIYKEVKKIDPTQKYSINNPELCNPELTKLFRPNTSNYNSKGCYINFEENNEEKPEVILYENGGENLDTYIDRLTYQPRLKGRIGLDREDILDILRHLINILEGIVTFNTQGLFHCDIKESNIIVGKMSNSYKLIDFGMAQHIPELVNDANLNVNTLQTLTGLRVYYAPQIYYIPFFSVLIGCDENSNGEIVYNKSNIPNNTDLIKKIYYSFLKTNGLSGQDLPPYKITTANFYAFYQFHKKIKFDESYFTDLLRELSAESNIINHVFMKFDVFCFGMILLQLIDRIGSSGILDHIKFRILAFIMNNNLLSLDPTEIPTAETLLEAYKFFIHRLELVYDDNNNVRKNYPKNYSKHFNRQEADLHKSYVTFLDTHKLIPQVFLIQSSTKQNVISSSSGSNSGEYIPTPFLTPRALSQASNATVYEQPHLRSVSYDSLSERPVLRMSGVSLGSTHTGGGKKKTKKNKIIKKTKKTRNHKKQKKL